MSQPEEERDTRPIEIPEITIEVTRKSHKNHTLVVGLWVAGFALIIACILLAAHLFRNIDKQLPASLSVEENIGILNEPYNAGAKGTVVTYDSVLGVAMDFYSLNGLRASLEYSAPDTADQSLVLSFRCVDYRPDYSLMGTVVIDGELISDSEQTESRPAYMAISAEGRPTIGIDYTDKMSDFAVKNGGEFFRQQVLLSNGALPPSFILHGKVERAAVGRKPNNDLYYIVTRHKETMYDFADALREYGFIDAMYITGGNSWQSYRDTTGVFHSTPDFIEKLFKYEQQEAQIPLVIFRR